MVFVPALEGFMNLHAVNCPHEQIAGHLADGLTRIKESQQFVWLGQSGKRVPAMMEAWGERSPVIFVTGSRTLKRQGSGDLKVTMSPLLRL